MITPKIIDYPNARWGQKHLLIKPFYYTTPIPSNLKSERVEKQKNLRNISCMTIKFRLS
jgi:hypothetical protein